MILFLFFVFVASKKYQYVDYASSLDLYKNWATTYPDILSVIDAHDQYSLPVVGKCKDSAGKRIGCRVKILEISEKATLNKARPAVFFSGAIHGNEWPGVTATIEFAKLLLENWKKEKPNKWLQYLVANRRILVVPSANADGYSHVKREEAGIDPNRDFPYDQNPDHCMQTVAARVWNELFRDYIIVSGLTFHGGTTNINYEWGDFFHKSPKDWSPDHLALKQIGESLSVYAGPDEHKKPMPYGTINSQVYPVHGGSEDWAYGTSWMSKYERKTAFQPCTPKTHGGYAKEKTIYTDKHLRSVFMLVETHDQKKPRESILGNDKNVLNSDNQGLISRLMRQCLLMTEIAEPYIVITSLDIGLQGITISWEVNGCYEADNTFVRVTNKKTGKMKETTKKTKSTRWAKSAEMNRESKDFDPMFTETIDLDDGEYEIIVLTSADQHWGDKIATYPDIQPQSHLVNQRINPKWNVAFDKSKLQGKLQFQSESNSITIGQPALPSATVLEDDFKNDKQLKPNSHKILDSPGADATVKLQKIKPEETIDAQVLPIDTLGAIEGETPRLTFLIISVTILISCLVCAAKLKIRRDIKYKDHEVEPFKQAEALSRLELDEKNSDASEDMDQISIGNNEDIENRLRRSDKKQVGNQVTHRNTTINS